MCRENCGWKQSVLRELSQLVGKRVEGVRVGDGGFDLVFDDGSELEVYVFPRRDGGECCWGVVVARYKRFRVGSLEEAQRLAEMLAEMAVDTSIIGPLSDGTVYLGVYEKHLDKLEEICRENSEVRRALGC